MKDSTEELSPTSGDEEDTITTRSATGLGPGTEMNIRGKTSETGLRPVASSVALMLISWFL